MFKKFRKEKDNVQEKENLKTKVSLKAKFRSLKEVNMKEKRQRAVTSWKGSLHSKGFKIGGYSVLACVAVIAIAVVINLVAGQLPSKVTNIDLTTSNVLSLSDQTKEIVGDLDQDITIYFLVQSGNEDETISQLLDRYADLSDKVTIKTIDPVVYPNFASQYTSDTVTDNSLIVVSGDKSRYIDSTDIYVTEYSSDYSSSSTSFDGESELTSAIQYVATETSGKIYLLTGHGEADLPDSVTEAIANQNMDLEQISLLTEGSIPDDADCVMIYSPASDISSEEKDMIITYLDGGGSLLLITDYVDEDMTNLYALEENYGVKTDKGIVMEGNSNNCIQGYNYYLLPEIDSQEITDPLIDEGYYVLMPLAQGISETGDAPNTVTITPLLTTSDEAYSKVAGSAMTTYDKEDGDIDGPFYLGVAITEDLSATSDTSDSDTTDDSEDTSSKEAKIVFYSTSAFLEDSVSEIVSGANMDLFVNSIGYLCDQQDSVSIHAKTVSADYLTVSSASASFWAFVVIALIPGVFLLVGIVKWIRRRKR